MRLNQNKFFSGSAAFAFLLLCSVLFCGAVPAGAQQGLDAVLTSLQANAKLHAPDDILADFVNGEPETAVIVLLRPSADAMALADLSRASSQVPAEFTAPGAATYYNLQDESVRTQLQSTVKENVSRVVDSLGTTGITVTQRFSYQFGFSARVTPEALQRIVNSPDVITVEKDAILNAHLAQGIPLMNANIVRGTHTGAGLSIAICDTGIDTSHPRLGGGAFPNAKVIGGYDTGDNDADPRPGSAGEAHGTACAGIAAGSTGTVGDYIGGVAPDAKLYAVKISTGTSGSASTSAMVAGWEWSITHKNDDPANPILIISTSFGGGQYLTTCDSDTLAMTTAAANAVAAGITIFASSGNDGYCNSMGWPACISYVNSVGAVYDANFGTYYPCVNSASCAIKTATTGCATGYYSTDGTSPDKVTSYSNSASFLTLFAPSNSAYTTDIVGTGGYGTGAYDTSFGGTSAACPYAAGSAAVLQSAAKAKTGSYLTPAQVKSYLVSNGDNVTDSKVAVTKPRINLERAVNAIAGSSDVPTPQSPSGTITDTTPAFKWTTVTGATQYRFKLQQGTTVVYTKTVASSVCGTSTCSSTPATALDYLAYKWKVQAQVGGVWNAYSAFKTFTVAVPVPTPQSPTGTITDRTPTYKWTKVEGATRYRFKLMKGTTAVYTKTVASGACGTTTCANTPTTVLAYATHKWKVQAEVAGVWGAYSSFKNFTVSNPNAKPKAGFWEESSGIGEFYVTPDQSSVDDLSVYGDLSSIGCGIYKFTYTALIPITNNKFSLSGSYYGEGTFDTTTTAYGTVGLNNFNFSDADCWYSGPISGGPWNWTATWTDSTQPTITVDRAATSVIRVLDPQGPLNNHTIRAVTP